MEKTARLIAERLRESEEIHIYAHHDADGIAAAAILGHVLYRSDRRFRIRVVTELWPEDLEEEAQAVLCDLGSGTTGLPEDTVVIDHHLPQFSGPFHLNPRLYGLNGEEEGAASVLAYRVAQEMGDFRDLAGIALLGILGDRQPVTGRNREVVNEGIAQGMVSPIHDYLEPGREPVERLALAIDPYLPGLSGNGAAARRLVEACTSAGEVNVESLISRVILEIAPAASASALEGIYGPTYRLEREMVDQAHTLAALIDACGRAGQGGLALALCLRDPGVLEEAWRVMGEHRGEVIQALQSAPVSGDRIRWYQVEDERVISEVADILSRDQVSEKPVAVYAISKGGRYRVSLRCPPGWPCLLGTVVREQAAACGGDGGGHEGRAGATIDAAQLERFQEGLAEAIAG